MDKSLATLRSQLQTELRDPNDKTWTTSAKNQYINRAYFQVQKDNKFKWRENEKTVTLSSPYTIPTDFVMAEVVVKGTNFVRLIDKTALRKRGYNLTDTAEEPTFYYYTGTTISFYPVISADVTLDYRKKLTSLTDDSDVIAFPDDFADAIIKYAKYLAWSSPRGNRQSANEALADYGQDLALLMGSYGLQDINNLTFGLQSRLGVGARDNVLYN